MAKARYKLKLNKLDFISAVDQPAQETAKVLLIKRKGDVNGFARVAKVDEELGLVFCWAFTSKSEGSDYFDLHGDCIDQDFVKACADFMEGARAVDEMHDGQQTGRVVFAMPMTSEVAKAFGVTTETEGLMVAIRPSAEALEKFKTGEYTGVSIAGTGYREPFEKSRPVTKRSSLTTATSGHTHLVTGHDEAQSGFTSSESMPGLDYSGSHSHPWVKGGDGKIVIGEAQGHSHEVANTDSGIVDTTMVAARAPVKRVGVLGDARKSTTANAGSIVKPQTLLSKQENQMDPTEQIATLTKRTEALSKMLVVLAAMAPAQREYVAKLAPADLETFLAKPDTDRDAIVAKAAEADPVAYTTKSGLAIRKSAGELAIAMAKQLDDAHEQLAKSRIEADQARFEKRAQEEIGHLAGETIVKVAALKALDSITDEKVRGEAIAMLKGADAAMAELAKAKGFNPGSDATNATDPKALFTKKLAEFAKTVNKTPQIATSDFLGTREGAELYAAAYPRTGA